MAESISSVVLSKDVKATPAGEELESHLEELLIEVGALATRLEQDARRVQTEGDLPAGGSSVLSMLSRFGSLTVPQIARLDSTSRQNIQTIVNRLQREGCVELSPNPAHKRSELVRLTERGRASQEANARHADAYRRKILPRLSKEDLVRALELLRLIRAALGATTIAQPHQPQAKNRTRRTQPPSAESAPKAPKPERIQVSFQESELPVSLL
jgi:DNA-binding MarR family transcriptional regulator